MSTGRLAHIERLISHPKTSDNERAAAMRARTRIQAQQNTSSVPSDAWVGHKFTQDMRTMSISQIAKMIRSDISLARKVGRKAAKAGDVAIPDPLGEAPREVKIRVTSDPTYGITVVVQNIPRDWGYAMGFDRDGDRVELPSRNLVRLLRQLSEMVNAYNYDNSDSQIDYFEKNYFSHVDAEGPDGRCRSYSSCESFYDWDE